MARYINADNAIKEIRKLAEKHHSNGEYEFANGVLKAITRITSQPTADVKEVVRGEWDNCLDYYRCSNCGELCTIKTSFCCRCGADMREGVGICNRLEKIIDKRE